MYMSPNANRMHDVMNLRTKKGWRLLGKMIWRYKWIYLIMLLPGLALTIVFRYLPLPGILLAFKTYKPLFGDSSLYGFLGASPWVGMDPVSYTHLDVYKRQRRAFFFIVPQRSARRRIFFAKKRRAPLWPKKRTARTPWGDQSVRAVRCAAAQGRRRSVLTSKGWKCR